MKTASKIKPVRGIQRRKTREIKPVRHQPTIKDAPPTVAESIEKVLIGGDLSPLSPEERVQYHHAVCKSLGLNPLTGPFLYILFREADTAPAKLKLYATKDCAAQLRKIHRVSVIALRREVSNGMSTVEADVRDGTGKTDSAIGVVPLWKWKDRQRIDLTGREYANAIMKTETKAKRRATLSVCGLAFLDESELDTMQIIGGVTRDGRIYEFQQPQLPAASEEINPHEKHYLEREKEELSKYTPAQREVIEKRMAKGSQAQVGASMPPAEVEGGKVPSQVPAPSSDSVESLFYVETPSQMYELLGADALLKKHKTDLLTFLDEGASRAAHARLLKPEQLGKLLGWCERNKVQIKALEKNAK